MAKKNKTIKLSPAESGGQIYMSDSYAKEYQDAIKNLKNTDLEKLMRKELEEYMRSKGKTSKEIGRKFGTITGDKISESINVLNKKNKTKPRAFKNGGAVMNGRGPKFKGQS